MRRGEHDADLQKQLAAFGLGAHNYRAICLLPLVEVAWADDRIQDRERSTILEIARGHELLGTDAEAVLEGWLAERPAPDTFASGRELLVKLAFRRHGIGADLNQRAVESVVDFCALVAESAGGLFDMYWTVSGEERKAIKQIAQHLSALSKEADPHVGIEGHSLTPEWEQIVSEFTTLSPG